MHAFLITIVCLGQRHYEVRAYGSACKAVIDTLDRYPRACCVSVRCLRGRST